MRGEQRRGIERARGREKRDEWGLGCIVHTSTVVLIRYFFRFSYFRCKIFIYVGCVDPQCIDPNRFRSIRTPDKPHSYQPLLRFHLLFVEKGGLNVFVNDGYTLA